MKKLINATTLLFFVFAAAVFITSFNGPGAANSQEDNIIYKYPIEKWWYGFRGYTADDSNVAAAKGCLEKAYIRDMGLDKKNLKRTFRDILDNPISPDNYIGGGYISQGLIKEITPDELAGVKARGENTLLFVVDKNNLSHPDILMDAILFKNLYELAGGRDGDAKFNFIALDPKDSARIFKEENLDRGLAFVLYFKNGEGKLITDCFEGVPDDSDELRLMLDDPKYELNLVKWIKTNTNKNNPNLILFKGTHTPPTYSTK